MQFIKKSLMVASIGLVGIASAQANVVYGWNPDSNTEQFATIGGTLVISDSAYRSGRAVFDGEGDYYHVPDSFRFPDSPIIRLAMSFDAKYGAFEISANPRRGREANAKIYNLSTDIGVVGDTLTGKSHLLTIEDQFDMTSDDSGLWTISRFGSDRLIGGDCGGPLCSGATGRWQLVSGDTDLPGTAAPTDVPAPSAWGLLGLSVLGMLGLAWRRQRDG